MKVSVEVKGMDQLLAQFKELGDERKMNAALKPILRVAARPTLAAARALVPIGTRVHVRSTKPGKKAGSSKVTRTQYDPGNLKKSLGIYTKKKDRGAAVVYVGPRVGKSGHDGYYAHMVEFGTRYQPAQPFMRPAIQQTAGVVTKKIEQSFEKTVDRVVKKYKAK